LAEEKKKKMEEDEEVENEERKLMRDAAKAEMRLAEVKDKLHAGQETEADEDTN
jgi:hypothetical protein